MTSGVRGIGGAAVLLIVGMLTVGGSSPGAGGPGVLPVTAAAAVDIDPCADVPRAPFVDVADTAAAAPGIDCLVWHELVSGVTHDRFAPRRALTRAQLATLLDRTITELSGPLPTPTTAAFPDVTGVHAPAIARLAAAGIITGRADGSFGPDLAVRRDQLAALVVRAADHVPGVELPTSDGHAFTDLTGNVHEAAIAVAVASDLLTGTTPTTFTPMSSATRGQTAAVLARLVQRIATDGASVGILATAGGYEVRAAPLPGSLLAAVEASTWRPGCPVHPRDLRLLEIVHTDFSGTDRWGQLLVHKAVAPDVGRAFGELYDEGFRIARMQPVERFGGDDDASMAANNTSAFNCRRVTGSTTFSQHAYGEAIDLNPVQNPYVRGTTVLPPAGRDYLDRSDVRPGMVVRSGAVAVFERIGWGWGGDFRTFKDYQHVSRSGG